MCIRVCVFGPQSILQLARKWGEFKVTERDISMHEFTEAVDQGRVSKHIYVRMCVCAPYILCVHMCFCVFLVCVWSCVVYVGYGRFIRGVGGYSHVFASIQVIEAFGAGTAAVVSPIKKIHFNGKVGHASLQNQ